MKKLPPKLKKMILPSLFALMAIGFGIHFIASPLVQKKMMGEFNKELFISQKGNELHSKLFIADMHADTLLWERDFFSKNDYGHVDLPRMQEGGFGLQIFTIVTKAPTSMDIKKTDGDKMDRITPLTVVQAWPISTWFSLFPRAVHQISKLTKIQTRSRGEFMVIRTRKDLLDFIELKSFNKKMVGGIIGLEGAHAIEADLRKLNILFSSGLRVLGLTHFFDNEVAGSAHGLEKKGLTEFGKKLVARSNELGLIFDISHLSEAASFELIKLSKRPVINTHTGLRGKCKNERNITDELALAVAERGGLIGIGFWPTATCGETVKSIAEMIKYATDLVGVDHVALGSDFDGTVTTPIDSSQMASLTSELLQAGYDNEEVRKIMGENVKNFFLNHLP